MKNKKEIWIFERKKLKVMKKKNNNLIKIIILNHSKLD